MQHKLLIRFFLVAVFGLIYSAAKSDKNGRFNGGTNCATCHGSASAATTIALTGLPTTFETGKTYTLTFNVTNTTNLKAGFNILVSAGTLIAGTNSRINASKNQITHSAPIAATGTTTSFTFSWKAPATINTITFNLVGNAVNGNNQDDAGDNWATSTISLGGKFPSGIVSSTENVLKCYPNPATDKICLEGLTSEASNICIYNVQGQQLPVKMEYQNNRFSINTENLEKGIYFVTANDEGKKYTARFIKN